jgi:predicted metal-binding protein
MTMEELLALGRLYGFEHVGELNVSALEPDPRVREMCAADRCHLYGRCWACPPYCGTLEEIGERIRGYGRGILLQSTGQMEDEFDYEAIQATLQRQQSRFRNLASVVRRAHPHCLPMTSGGCVVCRKCTCPDAPCRFPDKAMPSMEACGLLVSKVCLDSGLGYHYGPRTITFTACILLD